MEEELDAGPWAAYFAAYRITPTQEVLDHLNRGSELSDV